MILSISPQELTSLRAFVETGLQRATARLCQKYRVEALAALRSCRAGALARFPEEAPSAEQDLVAGVLVRFEGGIAGTALFAMDPEDALAWVRSLGENSLGEKSGSSEGHALADLDVDDPDFADPIGAYVAAGSAVLGELISELASGLGTASEAGRPSLEEDGVAPVLLRTHAPSDTVVLTLRFDLSCEERSTPASTYVLMEPKGFRSALVAS